MPCNVGAEFRSAKARPVAERKPIMRNEVLMKVAVMLLAIVLQIPAARLSAAAGEHYVDLSFSQRDAWTVSADDPWWSLIDIRNVLNLFHPLVESRTGALAGASRQCTIPADWQPPFLLRFHAADDYFADPEKHKVGMPGTESYFDHRFKQVLIDDQVVWDRDVIDDNMPTSQADFEVDITPYVTPGKPFRLSMRVLDKTSTLERNDRDVRFIGGTWYAQGDAKTEQPPRFHTAVWFADPVIGEAAAVRAAPAGVRPNEIAAQLRHEQRWPIPPPSKPLTLPTHLSLVCPDAIPAPGFPMTCGVPMPPGLCQKGQRVTLVGDDGKAVPVQSQATGWWPDGSVRWLLLDAIVPAHSANGEQFRAALSETDNTADVAATGRLAISEANHQVTIDTGPLHISLGSSPSTLLDSVRIGDSDSPALIDVRVRMTVKRESADAPVVAITEQTRIVQHGPISACVESSGSLMTDASLGSAVPLGRFTFRLSAYTGLPVLRTSIRIYNDTRPEPFQGSINDKPLEVTDLAVIGTVPGRVAGQVAFGSADGSVLQTEGAVVELRQDAADHFAVSADAAQTADGQQAQGWIAASAPGGCLQASVWRFWQQAPKSLSVSADKLTVGLFTAAETAPRYLPRYGEAKRHDIWLNFSPNLPAQATLVAWGKLADQPPRLFDGPWYCESGAIDLLDPEWPHNVPELAEWIGKSYDGVTSAAVGNNHWGLRDYGDFPYTPPMWRNGYYARILGAVHWGLASGDQRWLERSFEMARHIADVDTVHIKPGHADWDAWDGMTCASERTTAATAATHAGRRLWRPINSSATIGSPAIPIAARMHWPERTTCCGRRPVSVHLACAKGRDRCCVCCAPGRPPARQSIWTAHEVLRPFVHCQPRHGLAQGHVHLSALREPAHHFRRTGCDVRGRRVQDVPQYGRTGLRADRGRDRRLGVRRGDVAARHERGGLHLLPALRSQFLVLPANGRVVLRGV